MSEVIQTQDQPAQFLLLERLERIEEEVASLKERAKVLQELTEAHQAERLGPSPSDQFVNDFARLVAFMLHQFPQLIKRLEEDIAIVLPGLTGCGEVGPGGVQFPNNDGGGTLKRDFYKRGFG